MMQFLQPLFAAILGAAMFVLGLIQSWLVLPAPGVWQQVVTAAPQLTSVLLFLACAAIAVVGVILAVRGIRGIRRRMRQLRHVRWQPDRYEEMDEAWR